jgi:hypothetical protein
MCGCRDGQRNKLSERRKFSRVYSGKESRWLASIEFVQFKSYVTGLVAKVPHVASTVEDA